MSLEWLEGKTDEAARGIDAAILDMFKSLGNPTHIQVLGLISESPKRFTDLKESVGAHQQKLSRDLAELQEHQLAQKTEDNKYIITPFGKHVLGIILDLSRNREP